MGIPVHSLAGEIIHVLKTSPEPVHLSEMRVHLETRFTATLGSINSSIRRLEGSSLHIYEHGYLHRLTRSTEHADAQETIQTGLG